MGPGGGGAAAGVVRGEETAPGPAGCDASTVMLTGNEAATGSGVCARRDEGKANRMMAAVRKRHRAGGSIRFIPLMLHDAGSRVMRQFQLRRAIACEPTVARSPSPGTPGEGGGPSLDLEKA